MGITNCTTDGAILMGIPFGTDKFINQQLFTIVGEYTSSIGALDYFIKHHQWTILRQCINTRPHFLVRSMSKFHGWEVYKIFDNLITAKILKIADIKSGAVMYAHAHLLRSLRNVLGGGMTPCVAANHFQVKRKRQARIRILPKRAFAKSEIL